MYQNETLTETEPTSEQWLALHHAFRRYCEARPWERLGNEDILVVNDPLGHFKGYCVALGDGGVAYGLGAYLGDRGLLNYLTTMTSEEEPVGAEALERIFGTRPVWRDSIRVQVGDPTHTIVDVLDKPSLGGGIRHVAKVVGEYFRGEHRDDELLVDYMMKVGNGAAYKRLGYLLEELGIAAPGLLGECREGITAGISMLDPDLPRSGPAMRRWNLRVNGNVN